MFKYFMALLFIMEDFGKLFILIGVVFLLLGFVWTFAGKTLPLGKLPGDFAWEKGNFKVYFPLATSIFLSILLSLFLWFFLRNR